MKLMRQNCDARQAGKNHMRKHGQTARFVLFSMAALLLLMTACSLPGKSPKKPSHFYLLQGGGYTSATTECLPKPCPSLRISTPVAAPGYDTTRIAYVTEPPRLDYFAHHLWVDPPARMLATAMEVRLDASGLFGAVLSQTSGVDTNLRLDTELLRLQQVFSGNSSSVELVVKVVLVDLERREWLVSHTFEYEEIAAGANPAAGVDAAERAVTRFLNDLTEFLAAAMRPQPSA